VTARQIWAGPGDAFLYGSEGLAGGLTVGMSELRHRLGLAPESLLDERIAVATQHP
jgi:hypothetical protein